MRGEDKINQSQFYDLITGEELSWQAIIYDLIKTEQLNPWDIDLGVLADKYVEAIQKLEDADFYLSSKVLLACSLLLRLKTEILANDYIQSLNDILFGKKESQTVLDLTNFSIDEGELPLLVPKTPMARSRKVTLDELMGALNHAMATEHRRIKREIKVRQAEKSSLMVLPKSNLIPLKVRVKNIFGIISDHLNKPGIEHLKFHEMAKDHEEQMASFLPVLHLSNDGKIFLYQPVHFEEIHIRKTIHPEEKRELEDGLGFAE
jgi:segregation and condensation protein A